MDAKRLTPKEAKAKIQKAGKVMMPVEGLCSSNIEVVKEDVKYLLDDLNPEHNEVLYSETDYGHWISIREKTDF